MPNQEPTGFRRSSRVVPALAATLAAMLILYGSADTAAQPRAIVTESGTINVDIIASGLVHPWGLAFLPNGDMLVTERPGRLRIVTQQGQIGEPVQGVPEVFHQGQGGLLDVVLDPDFEDNGLVYLAFAEPGPGGACTAVARGKLDGMTLRNTETIFRQQPKVDGENHFGGRLAFTEDGKLFVTMGERFKFEPAQNPGNHLGTIARINPDGSVPADNPFAGRDNALPEIWSFGHRNIEAAFVHPDTNQLWVAEMGPLGGDELNLPQAGANYGWPVVSWGRHYDGRDIPDPPTHPEFADAIHQWTPVISPSGMILYTGDLIEQWQGDVLIGGLSSRALVRLDVDGAQVTGEEQIDMGVRIREVTQGPQGAIYLTTDEENGRILRLSPQDRRPS